ncbi:hypothetical protein [Paracoccus haeundaensis]|uniref:Uncharacterized protein n=1 Tax=Paracoccus haeundaensis TaxID=225362 RepID=A0A5C4R315_9RHOB|nr:hypothetical protein [Paracoccus haeundaensis]TNH38077.1 hypothetical protein FHD67_16675 [Paracoccus haeundaensis]
MCDDSSRPDLIEQHFKDGSASVRACQMLAAPSLNAPDVCLEKRRTGEVGQMLDPLSGGAQCTFGKVALALRGAVHAVIIRPVAPEIGSLLGRVLADNKHTTCQW